MIEKKIEGFLLKKVTYKDNDAILNVLTKDGVVTFKARGILKAKSKNASSCNYNILSEYNLTSTKEGNNFLLKNSSTIKMYYLPYESMLLMSSFLFISNIAYLVSESINIYDLSIECFDKLESKEEPINVLVYFLKEVCNKLGYTPYLKGCINCNSKNNLVTFSLKEGGFICKKCCLENQYEKYSKEYLNSLYHLYKDNSYENIDKTRAIRIFSYLVTFMKEEVGIKITNEKFIYESL